MWRFGGNYIDLKSFMQRVPFQNTPKSTHGRSQTYYNIIINESLYISFRFHQFCCWSVLYNTPIKIENLKYPDNSPGYLLLNALLPYLILNLLNMNIGFNYRVRVYGNGVNAFFYQHFSKVGEVRRTLAANSYF